MMCVEKSDLHSCIAFLKAVAGWSNLVVSRVYWYDNTIHHMPYDFMVMKFFSMAVALLKQFKEFLGVDFL